MLLRNRYLNIFILVSTFLFLLYCNNNKEAKNKNPQKNTNKIILATTTSVYDTGLLDVLLKEFYKQTGLKVSPLAVGSGRALRMGSNGEADILIVHSPESEKKFMQNQDGEVRVSLMHNYFLIVGPKTDPAKVADATSVEDAFRRIANSKSKFVSRGDESGTNVKELQIWSGIGIRPNGKWYIQAGQGQSASLKIADEMQAYMFLDTGTYRFMSRKISLVPVYDKKEEILKNYYHIIVVNPKKHKNINHEGAMQLLKFLKTKWVKNTISGFGRGRYLPPFFEPEE